MITWRVKHSVEKESFVLEVGEDEYDLTTAETYSQALDLVPMYLGLIKFQDSSSTNFME